MPSNAVITTKHVCPVCRRGVTRTRNHRIAGHYDTCHNVCPGSFVTFDYAIIRDGIA